jgi:hypothetical protein
MNLEKELLQEFSKSNTMRIANIIGAEQTLFDELIDIMVNGREKSKNHAAWVLSHCADTHPWLLEKHKEALLLNLQMPAADSVKRNSLRVLRYVNLPEDLMGIAADLCFGFLNSGKEPVAIKVHAMDVLYKIVVKYPELKEELRVSIEEQMPYGSAGFKSHGSKVLKNLHKLS